VKNGNFRPFEDTNHESFVKNQKFFKKDLTNPEFCAIIKLHDSEAT